MTRPRAALDLGYVSLYAGEYEKAITAFKQAEQTYRPEEQFGKSIALIGQSRALLGLQKGKEAQKTIQQAEKLVQQLSDRINQGKALLKLSDVYYALGQVDSVSYKQALEKIQQARQIFVEEKERRREAAAVTRLANLYYFQEDYKPALKAYKEVQVIFQELKDRSSEISALMNLGQVYLEDPECYEEDNEVKCYKEAEVAFKQALSLAKLEDASDRTVAVTRARILLGLGDTYLAWRQFDKALDYSKQALDAFEQLSKRNELPEQKVAGLYASEIQRA